jgi:hypothetical protein
MLATRCSERPSNALRALLKKLAKGAGLTTDTLERELAAIPAPRG